MFRNSEKTQHRKKFTREEDEKLMRLVKKFGTKSWEEVSKFMPRRCGRQCRDRYNNYLLENFTKGPWTPEEDNFINQKYDEIGPHWVEISKMMPGRSGNDVKNRWHKTLSKRRLLQQHSANAIRIDLQNKVNVSNTVPSFVDTSTEMNQIGKDSNCASDSAILSNQCENPQIVKEDKNISNVTDDDKENDENKKTFDPMMSFIDYDRVWDLFPLNTNNDFFYDFVLY